jgi:steroid 5-alpha reductase family enzyme
MKKADRSAVITLVVAVLLGAGLAWAGSQGSVRFARAPLFALCVALAFLIQWIAFIPAYLKQPEKFFDITGSLTYIILALLAGFLSGMSDVRSYLVMLLVLVWAGRLGSFLFMRVQRAGKDARFDEIKPSFPRFLQTWTLQALWIVFTLAAALVVLTSTTRLALAVYAYAGLAIWVFGFAFEVIADAQKSAFRKDPQNKRKFIHGGLWSWSRHPNYFGEITLWVGMALIALPVLHGWQWIALISPIFVYFLLTRVSGIPLLEKRADAKWGGQPDYEVYKSSTSLLFPLPPAKKN